MPFEEDQKQAKKFINKSAETIVRLFPLGGSTGITLSFFLKQDWLIVGVMFPIMVVIPNPFGKVYLQRSQSSKRSLITQWQASPDRFITL